ncbi:IS3 family transposase [Bradyrhizobium sp. AUGA SZCCT0158]|uniref:IS3 family transposase n=1 Tax=Bradyrhizobium sp. AUGA SZCCT0158 TaxID=2807661 RepID=UPI001BA4DFC5
MRVYRSAGNANCCAARSSIYRPPRPANDNDVELMRRIDHLFTAWPFPGSRRMMAMLNGEGGRINRKRVHSITQVAKDLGEDWLRNVANEMEIEDGVIRVYGVGEDGVQAFTDFGIAAISRGMPR